jgi:hypothetical protein
MNTALDRVIAQREADATITMVDPAYPLMVHEFEATLPHCMACYTATDSHSRGEQKVLLLPDCRRAPIAQHGRSTSDLTGQAAGAFCRRTNPLPSGSLNRAYCPHGSCSIGATATPRARKVSHA